MVVFFPILLLLACNVPLDVHGETKDVDGASATTLARLLTVGVATQEAVGDWVGALLVVVLGVDSTPDQILVELRLFRVEGFPFELVDRCLAVPERVALQFVPGDPFDGVFLEQPLN